MKMIHLVTTGGVIDLGYGLKTGDLEMCSPSIRPILGAAGIRDDEYVISMLSSKKGTDISAAERVLIARFISQVEAPRVLVTHDIDSIQDMARAIDRAQTNKTVVLTGANVPWRDISIDCRRIEDSDAGFNIGFACAVVQMLPPGVYIALRGVVHQWEEYGANQLGKCGCDEVVSV